MPKTELWNDNKSLQDFLQSLHINDGFDDSEIFVKVPQAEKKVLYSFKARNSQELTVDKGQMVWAARKFLKVLVKSRRDMYFNSLNLFNLKISVPNIS